MNNFLAKNELAESDKLKKNTDCWTLLTSPNFEINDTFPNPHRVVPSRFSKNRSNHEEMGLLRDSVLT